MALKVSNKNRKSVAITNESVQKKCPLHSWWWLPNNPKLYAVFIGLILVVVLFL